MWAKYTFDRQLSLFASQSTAHNSVLADLVDIADKNRDTNITVKALEGIAAGVEKFKELADDIYDLSVNGVPDTMVVGFSNGGDFLKGIKAIFGAGRIIPKGISNITIIG